MSSLNIFDVFGERIINEINNRIQERIEDYNKTVDEKISKTEEIVNTINISKNYISLDKKKRIVGVNPSIDNNDVVIKEELDELKLKLENYISDFNDFKKDIITHINNYNEFKNYISTHINNYNEVKKDLDTFKQDTGKNLVNIYTKLGIFPKTD